MYNKNIRSLAVYGYGYVGQAFVEYAKNYVDIVIYDPKFTRSNNRKKLEACDAAVICLPTPPASDGSCDTSLVEETIKLIPHKIVLIKSTVSPGTTARMAEESGKEILFCPEFISESTYQNPYFRSMTDAPFIILGGTQQARDAWIEFFQNIHGPMTKYYGCSSTEAELIKYTANVYSALKITFVNEMYEITKSFDADWQKVREGWLLDERVEPMSTMVFPTKRGYSGKCLPKDTLALVRASQKVGYTPELIAKVHTSNLTFAAERLGDFLTDAQSAAGELPQEESEHSLPIIDRPHSRIYLATL